MKQKLLWSLVIIISVIQISFAQDIEAFNNKKAVTNNFFELEKVIHNEYKSLPDSIRKNGGEGYLKQKKVMRHLWWQSLHLGGDGEYVNAKKKIYEETQKIKEKFIEKSTNSNWSLIGPTSSNTSYSIYNGIGRVDRIGFHPTNSNIIYIGAPNGGLWKSTNGGNTWSPMSSYAPSLGISGIVVSHHNPSHIYVLTGDGDSSQTTIDNVNGGYIYTSIGLMKSTDGGETWGEAISINSSSLYYGYALAQDPDDASILYAGMSNGLYKSVDYGDTWSQVSSSTTIDVKILDRPTNRVVYSGINFIRYSEVTGSSSSTSTIDAGVLGTGVKVCVSPNDPDLVYAINSRVVADSTFGGIYKSIDGGVTFDREATQPNVMENSDSGAGTSSQSPYNLSIACHPDNTDTLFTAGTTIWQSVDSGNTLTKNTSFGENGAFTYIHPDVHEVKYNPRDNKLYAATDGGVYMSSDDGQSWNDITNGMCLTMSYGMDKADDGSNRIGIGNQDNGYKVRTNSSGSDFHHITGGDGFKCALFPGDPSTSFFTSNGSVVKVTNDGSNRNVIDTFWNWGMSVVCHNTNDDIVLVGRDNIIRRTVNGGSNWTTINNVGGVHAISSCPSNNSRFYSCGRVNTSWFNNSNRAFMSADIGATWVDLSTTHNSFPAGGRFTDITPTPTNSRKVYMTKGGFDDGNKVFYLNEIGPTGTWTNISGSLPNVPAHCIAVADNGDLYVGTSIGVFYRSNTMTDWMPYSNNLPNVTVTDIKLDHALNKIYVSTWGRGVWQANMSNNICVSNMYIYSDQEGDKFYEADNSILAYNDIDGSAHNSIYMKAGEKVVLKPGFKAEANSFMRAYIEDCGDGGVPSNLNNSNSSDNKSSQELTNNTTFDLRHENDSVILSLYIKKKSEYDFYVIDQNGNKLEHIESIYLDEGASEIKLKMANFKNLLSHSVGMFTGDRRVYCQELN